jgi:hypothetical protein
MNTMRCLPLLFSLYALPCLAGQIFVYEDPGGQKILSDHPLAEPDYKLIAEKKTLRNLGRYMSGPPAGQTGDISAAVDRICAYHQVDPFLVKAIIKAESSFDSNALSRKGAMGLMQLMDDTADQYRVNDSLDPEENIDAGVRHLSWLLKRFAGDVTRALAAFNAGVTAVDKYQGIPPFPETRRYVRKVLAYRLEFEAQATPAQKPTAADI